jgi:hypothetical protein
MPLLNKYEENLWTKFGQQATFNPLTSGWKTVPIGLGDYIVSIIAKSASGATLQVTDYQYTKNIDESIALTSDYKEYRFPFKETVQQLFYIRDKFSTGDIIIKSIKLTRKAPAAPTLNGISDKVENWEQGEINPSNGQNSPNNIRIRTKDFSLIPSGGKIKASSSIGYEAYIIYYYDSNKNYLSYKLLYNGTDITPINAKYFKVITRKTDNSTITPSEIEQAKPLLVLGDTQIPYEPKKGERMVKPYFHSDGSVHMFPKAKEVKSPKRQGAQFNGINQYFKLPSMTMDSIEIEMTLDKTDWSTYVLDARPGYNGYVYNTNIAAGSSGFVQQGVISSKERRVIKYTSNQVFTDDVTILADRYGASATKGTLYTVKCLLNDNVVAKYDFTGAFNQIIKDVSGNGHDGEVFGKPTTATLYAKR